MPKTFINSWKLQYLQAEVPKRLRGAPAERLFEGSSRIKLPIFRQFIARNSLPLLFYIINLATTYL